MKKVLIFLCFLPLGLLAQKKDTTFTAFIKLGDEAFLTKKDSVNALVFYKKAINSAQTIKLQRKDSIDLMRVTENAGIILKKTENLFEALQFFQQAFILSRKISDKETIYRIIPQIAHVYKLMRNKGHNIKIPPAQEYKTEEIYYSITDQPDSTKDTLFVMINGGITDGIYTASTGRIVGTYINDDENHGNSVLGKATVEKLDTNKTLLRIIPTDKQTGTYKILQGDMAWVLSRVPKNIYNSVFRKLSARQIILLDPNKNPFYVYYQLMAEDSPELEADILEILRREDIKTCDWLYGLEDKSKYIGFFNDTLTSGRFKGMTVVDAMNLTKADDIMAFFDFVLEYPGKYIGKSWIFSEVYVTWLMHNSPIGLQTFIALLLDADTDADFKDIADKYKEEITENRFFISTVNTAETVESSEKDKALLILYKVLKLSGYLSEKSNEGWAYFGLGHVYFNSDMLDSSKYYFEKAFSVFEATDVERGKAQSLNFMGLIFNFKQQYKESLECYKKSLKINQEIASQRGYYIRNDFSSLASTEAGIGYQNNYLGNYEEALTAFQHSISWRDSLQTVESRKLAAGLLTQIAKVYKKRGQFDEAITIYEKQLTRYAELGENLEVASIYDDIADIQFSLGRYQSALDIWLKAYDIKIASEKWSDAGYSMSNCGQAMWNIGYLDSAIICHNTAIELRKKGNDREGQAFSFTKAAYLYKSIGQPDKAEKYYQEALDIYLELGDSIEIAAIANYIGRFYVDLKNYTAAADFYEIARKVYETRQMKSELAEIYSNMGTLYSNLKTYSESLKYHAKALEIRRQLNERQNVMYSLIDIGFLNIFYTYNPDTALGLLNEALVVADSTGSIEYKAMCLQNMGYAYSLNGKAAKAEEYFLKSLKVYQSIADTMGQSMIICFQGDNELIRGDFAKALSHYNTSLMLARSKNFQAQMGEIYIKLTSYYYLTGEFNNAFSMIDSAYSIYYENNNMNGVAHTHISKGNTHNTIGNATEALKYYKIADSIFIALSDPLNSALAINNMGTIMYRQGDYDNALRLFRRGLDIIDSVGLNLSLKIYLTGNIGEVYMESGIWDEAEKYLNMSIRLAEELLDSRMVWSSSTILGKLKSKQEKFKESNIIVSECYNSFLKSDEKMAIAECATILGYNYLKLKDYQKAKEYLNNAIQIYRTIGSRRTLWEPLYYMALLEKEENNIPEALNFLKEAVANIEDLSSDIVGDNAQKKLFAKANNKKDIYQSLITLLIQNNNVKEAWVYQEKLNVYGLEEQTRDEPTRGASIENSEDMKLSELELKKDGIYSQLMTEKAKPSNERRQEKILELEKMMTVAGIDYQNFLLELAEKGNSNFDFINTVNPEELDQKRYDMDTDIVVLQYLVTEDKIIIFIAAADTLGAKVIEVSQSNMEQYVNRYYNLLISKAPIESVYAASEQLYNVLIEPAKSLIGNKKKIAVVPGGVLFKLPFQSLGKMQNKKFDYLGSQYEIFYINDMNNTVIRESLLIDNADFLAFGNADNTLPFAEKEITTISQLFVKSNVYLKNEAHEDIAKNSMNNYQIVHFATHGTLDPIKFNNSYLTLAPNLVLNEDGMLTMNEVNGFRTLRNCQLIVLSACNTAVNDQKLEGWINNPAKAFLKKGAKTAVASLWAVDDAATGELMTNFYKNLFAGQNKVNAITNAQRTLINSEKFSHPYYWAAFELIGQWK